MPQMDGKDVTSVNLHAFSALRRVDKLDATRELLSATHKRLTTLSPLI